MLKTYGAKESATEAQAGHAILHFTMTRATEERQRPTARQSFVPPSGQKAEATLEQKKAAGSSYC